MSEFKEIVVFDKEDLKSYWSISNGGYFDYRGYIDDHLNIVDAVEEDSMRDYILRIIAMIKLYVYDVESEFDLPVKKLEVHLDGMDIALGLSYLTSRVIRGKEDFFLSTHTPVCLHKVIDQIIDIVSEEVTKRRDNHEVKKTVGENQTADVVDVRVPGHYYKGIYATSNDEVFSKAADKVIHKIHKRKKYEKIRRVAIMVAMDVFRIQANQGASKTLWRDGYVIGITEEDVRHLWSRFSPVLRELKNGMDHIEQIPQSKRSDIELAYKTARSIVSTLEKIMDDFFIIERAFNMKK